MKIWIDARICGEWEYYENFIVELLRAFIGENHEHEIVVYTQNNLKLNRLSFIDDITACKIFEKQKFGLMIFFDYHIPRGYKWDFIVLIESLKEVFFPKHHWLHRKIHGYKLSRAIEKSKSVLVLDTGTSLELNERLNISEDKIKKIHGFFPKYQSLSKSPITSDIKTKHNLRWEYLIYDSGSEIHNNFERILKTIKKLRDNNIRLYIIILCEATTKDLDLRGKVIEYDISDQILFLWAIPVDSESAYYEQSLGVIFSSIYESFPFNFSKAITYNCPIFANEIPANLEIMGDHISYLDPLSIHNMVSTLWDAIKKKPKNDYSDILLKYSSMHSAKELLEIIDKQN